MCVYWLVGLSVGWSVPIRVEGRTSMFLLEQHYFPTLLITLAWSLARTAMENMMPTEFNNISLKQLKYYCIIVYKCLSMNRSVRQLFGWFVGGSVGLKF